MTEFIGFYHVSEKGYCTKCKKVFNYGYNGVRGLLKGEGDCPTCGAGDIYGDIIRERSIETSIMMNRSFIHSDMTTDDQKRDLRHKVSDLNRIRRLFDETDD